MRSRCSRARAARSRLCATTRPRRPRRGRSRSWRSSSSAGSRASSSTSLAGRLLDDPNNDGLNVALWAFLGGAFYGLLVFWLGGLLVYAIAAAVRARASYRQARHVVGLAMAPVALSLLTVWPVRLAIYGEDVFRRGGSDAGAGDKLFEALIVGSFAWAFALVALGLIELRKSSSSSSGIA